MNFISGSLYLVTNTSSSVGIWTGLVGRHGLHGNHVDVGEVLLCLGEGKTTETYGPRIDFLHKEKLVWIAEPNETWAIYYEERLKLFSRAKPSQKS